MIDSDGDEDEVGTFDDLNDAIDEAQARLNYDGGSGYRIEDVYCDIVEEYTRRGLTIWVVNSPENGGPGMARQNGMDATPQLDFYMFLDADDMLMPRAVEVLSYEIQAGGYDVIAADILHENPGKVANIMHVDSTPCTWCHAKVYRASYLRENNIRFLPEFRLNEDAYFNLVAFNGGKSGMVKETMYIWRANPNSLTRSISNREFYRRTYAQYILTQIKGLKKMYEVRGDIPLGTTAGTIINIYKMMMREIYEKGQDFSYREDLATLKTFKPLQDHLDSGDFWITAIDMLPAAERTENSIFFYTQRFVDWVNEYLRPEGDQIVSLEGTEASDANSNSKWIPAMW
jgi:hypothetical protein